MARNSYHLECKNCGEQWIDRFFGEVHPTSQLSKTEKATLSWLVKKKHISSGKRVIVDEQLVDNAKSHGFLSPNQKLLILLESVHGRSAFFGTKVEFDPAVEFSLAAAVGSDELVAIIQMAEELQFLVWHGKNQVNLDSPDSYVAPMSFCSLRLTAKGWNEATAKNSAFWRSEQCFVAMSFNKEHEYIFAEGISPAIVAGGYQAFHVGRHEHNNYITEEILGNIRRSRFLVADFTGGDSAKGGKAGVYFESGYARGLGRIVINTVSKLELSDVHFDTKQISHIDWTDPSNLAKRLYNRIVVTVGEGPNFDSQSASSTRESIGVS